MDLFSKIYYDIIMFSAGGPGVDCPSEFGVSFRPNPPPQKKTTGRERENRGEKRGENVAVC